MLHGRLISVSSFLLKLQWLKPNIVRNLLQPVKDRMNNEGGSNVPTQQKRFVVLVLTASLTFILCNVPYMVSAYGTMHEEHSLLTSFHRPQMKFGQGNVFTTVCYSVHRVGDSFPACITGHMTSIQRRWLLSMHHRPHDQYPARGDLHPRRGLPMGKWWADTPSS